MAKKQIMRWVERLTRKRKYDELILAPCEQIKMNYGQILQNEA